MTQFKGVIVVPSGVMRQHPSVESSRLTVTHRLTVLLNWANHNYWPAFHGTHGSFLNSFLTHIYTHTNIVQRQNDLMTHINKEFGHIKQSLPVFHNLKEGWFRWRRTRGLTTFSQKSTSRSDSTAVATSRFYKLACWRYSKYHLNGRSVSLRCCVEDKWWNYSSSSSEKFH